MTSLLISKFRAIHALAGVAMVLTVPAALGEVPRAVTVARATAIPACTVFVDAAAKGGRGTAAQPFAAIADAVAAAAPGAVICVTEGSYTEQLRPGEKHLTLAGGFKSGTGFKVRDSAVHVSKASGRGGSFLRVEDPGPKGDLLTAIDGFDISGYAQAIYRDVYYAQRFAITNNHIHDNTCGDDRLAGAGFALNNVSGRISNNVIQRNRCGRGGAGFLNDSTNANEVVIEGNLIEANAGSETSTSHGGALYLFAHKVRVIGNLFQDNTVTKWGGGLYVGAFTEGGQYTTATLAWNVYRGNKAGVAGGGLFCDDGAACTSYHEIYDRNCGGNIYLDSGAGKSGPTTARFDHLTNHAARAVGCGSPGAGVRIDAEPGAADRYSFINVLFWGNAAGQDFATGCDRDCGKIRIGVAHSMVQRRYLRNGLDVTFGDGIVTPVDPLFAAPDAGDFHLRSRAGRWTPSGMVQDAATSPAIAVGHSEALPTDNPERAGPRNELGAFGNSREASFSR